MDSITNKEADLRLSDSGIENGLRCANGLNAFRVSPFVHHRPKGLKCLELTDRGVVLTLGVTARQSVLSYTHETALNLYRPAEPEFGELYLHIELWKDSIFRVVFSAEKKDRRSLRRLA